MGVGDFKFIDNSKTVYEKTSYDVFSCIVFGLVGGLIIGYFT
jgi:hypothetical protein